MTLNQFTFFAATAKHGSLTRASQELRISQPSVSQQLRLLERDSGAKLYRRNGKGIELTDAGRLFLDRIEPILEQVEQIKSIFPKREVRTETGHLKIGGTFGPSTLLLPSLAVRFKKTHAEIEIELRTRSVQRLDQLLLNGHVEIAVSTHRPHHPELAWEPFRRQRMVLFVSSAHPLARINKVTLVDVQAFPLVIRYIGGVHGATVRLLNELAGQGLKFKIGMRCEVPDAIKEVVKKNAGIGIVFEDVVKREVERGEFKILQGHGLKLESDTYILYRADRPLSALGQEFLGLLRKVCSGSRRTNGPASVDSSVSDRTTTVIPGGAHSPAWDPVL
ncbi:MAG: LysR family transcriptional regulator [Deltaproteobacteria bacterium]|nr:LysR family transcriptional regulator [Deltaproteobacteria bacterium]